MLGAGECSGESQMDMGIESHSDMLDAEDECDATGRELEAAAAAAFDSSRRMDGVACISAGHESEAAGSGAAAEAAQQFELAICDCMVSDSDSDRSEH